MKFRLKQISFRQNSIYYKTRVATHSGKLGKLREFSNYKKSQGNSRNFDFLFLTPESFEILKISGIFFLDIE